MDYYSWIALLAAEGVGPVLFRRLLERFDTPALALDASPEALSAVRGVTPQIISSVKGKSCRLFAERECLRIEQTKTVLLTFLDADYPRRLFETGSPPPLLYLRGKIPKWEPAIAVVGSRRASRDGMKIAERFSAELAAAGLLVVSGLARGIDTACHRGALQGGGETAAVLGCGVDLTYPAENIELACRIAENGCIVSEFPMGTQPLAEHFPRRNRIISGLSLGVLVIEAAEKSGSLITARYALEQGRDVMAVPGSINSVSCKGSNRLIKDGAQLVDCIEDIMQLIQIEKYHHGLPLFDSCNTAPRHSLTPREAAVYELVARGPLHIDEITQALELTSGEVSAMVLGLELKGMLTQLPGSYYSHT